MLDHLTPQTVIGAIVLIFFLVMAIAAYVRSRLDNDEPPTSGGSGSGGGGGRYDSGPVQKK